MLLFEALKALILGLFPHRPRSPGQDGRSVTGWESCIYCKHDGPPHDTTMAQSTKHQRRCHGCPPCRAEIRAENKAAVTDS